MSAINSSFTISVILPVLGSTSYVVVRLMIFPSFWLIVSTLSLAGTLITVSTASSLIGVPLTSVISPVFSFTVYLVIVVSFPGFPKITSFFSPLSLVGSLTYLIGLGVSFTSTFSFVPISITLLPSFSPSEISLFSPYSLFVLPLYVVVIFVPVSIILSIGLSIFTSLFSVISPVFGFTM